MELPNETLFDILLPLPVEEILNYCKTNREAAQICRSETFWKRKAEMIYDAPFKLIEGKTHSQRYQILEQIYTSENPVAEAIRLDQLDFLANLSPNYLKDNYENYPDEISDALFKTLDEGNIDTFRFVIDMITENHTEKNHLINNLYIKTAINGNLFILHLLSELAPINYTEMLFFTYGENEFERPEAFEEIIEDAKVHGKPNFVQNILKNISFDDVDYEELDDFLQYLLEHYRSELDLDAILLSALEQCPYAKDIYKTMKSS
jgi:hypothetical protein